MKIRLEGTKQGIDDFITYQLFNTQIKIKSKSKFYPNRNDAEKANSEKFGRVYIETK